ncbi:MAG TPA: hypothetical protein VN782_05205 [Usitatibacter sp.]|nr:hypothetical protein [Usitatibacter sp.]
MKDVNKWIAAVSMGLAALFAGLAAHAQDCDAAALTCGASQTGDASFLDLVRAGDANSTNQAPPRDALPRPAVYVPDASRAANTDDIAPAGVGALDSAMGTRISNDRTPAWLAFPQSIAAPDSSVAWLFAVGFLGFVILRRVRGTNSY